MLRVLFVLMLIATPAFAKTVNLGNDIYLNDDYGTVQLLTKAELEQKIVEQQNELHNAQVMSQRALESQEHAILDAQNAILGDVAKPEVVNWDDVETLETGINWAE